MKDVPFIDNRFSPWRVRWSSKPLSPEWFRAMNRHLGALPSDDQGEKTMSTTLDHTITIETPEISMPDDGETIEPIFLTAADQRRQIALHMAIESRTGVEDAKQIVDRAQHFLTFLNAGDKADA